MLSPLSPIEQRCFASYVIAGQAALDTATYRNTPALNMCILEVNHGFRSVMACPIGLALIGKLASLTQAEREIRKAQSQSSPIDYIASALGLSASLVQLVSELYCSVLTADCILQLLEAGELPTILD